ncbi:CorA family divalent cation transporter [Pseudidiomarina sp.]|uniref:CorA family divalent cation transporter n=1 Tax=Pseudidiomarina sp. TaxID=2081707 RepID=UPI003A984649
MTDKQLARPEFMIDSWDFSSHPAEPIHDAFHTRQNSWFHFQRNIAGLSAWLEQSGIPDPVIDAVLEEDTRPRFDRINDGFLLILRGVNKADGDKPEDMISLRILYFKGNLYSFRRRPVTAVRLIQGLLETQQGPQSLPDFILQLVDEMTNNIELLQDNIEVEMERLEDDERGTTSDRQRALTNLHRRLLRLTRFVRPQLAALDKLAADGPKWFDTEWAQWLLNERDNTHRELENMEMLLEQVWMLREHLHQDLAEKMNRNTYWLSMVAGVFLPISFLTGLFGINIGGMPGVDDSNAFWIFSGALLIIAVIEFLLLRRLRFW